MQLFLIWISLFRRVEKVNFMLERSNAHIAKLFIYLSSILIIGVIIASALGQLGLPVQLTANKSARASSANCNLNSAFWSAPKAAEGDAVELTIKGAEGCNGLTANFEIWEDDLIFDDHAKKNPQPAVFENGKAAAKWITEWQDDEIGNPEYYFIAKVNGKEIKPKEDLEVGSVTGNENIVVDAAGAYSSSKSLQGFLGGFADRVDFPDHGIVAQLKPRMWRVGLYPENYYIASSYGADITWETSGGYYILKHTWYNECGPGFQGCDCSSPSVPKPPQPWLDGFQEYKQYIKNIVKASIQNNIPVAYWDWWSEPNNYGRFGTQEQMFATFKAFHDAVREAEKETGVRQKIVAPSVENFVGEDWQDNNNCFVGGTRGERTFKLEDFLKFVEDNNLRLDALSWHEFPMPDDAFTHIRAVRQYFAEHPKLCNPTCPEIHINEYQGIEQHLLPGNTVGWIYNLEKSKVDWASRACWDFGCWGGLDGLLMQDSKTPQANYWVHRAYADMDGAKRLIAETSDTHTIALASKNDAAKEIRLLVGRYCNYGDKTWIDCYLSGVKNGPPAEISLQIKNYPYGTNAEVEIYRIPNNNNVPTALLSPAFVSKRTVAVQNNALAIKIENFEDNDAYNVVIRNGSLPVTPVVASVDVDASKTQGSVSPLFRFGASMWWYPGDIIKDTYLREQKRIGIVRTGLGLSIIGCKLSNGCDSTAKLIDWLRVSIAPEYAFLKEWKSKGGEITFTIDMMPEYLSSCSSRCNAAQCAITTSPPSYGSDAPVWGLMAPRDYEEYSRAVEAIVRYINDELGLNARYELYNEPEWIFVGTGDEYNKMYKAFAHGVKRVNSKIQVGPGGFGQKHLYNDVCNPGAFTLEKDPMLPNLLRYANANSLPVDLIIFHGYWSEQEIGDYDTRVKTVKKWFSENGFSPDTLIIDDEWNALSPGAGGGGANGGSERMSHEFTSTYVAHTLMTMENAGLSLQNYQIMSDPKLPIVYGKPELGYRTQWDSYTSPFTYENIIRPNFNAFKAFGELSGSKIELKGGNDYVKATASRDSDKISIALSNFQNVRVAAQQSADYLKSQGITIEYSKKEYTADILLSLFGLIPAMQKIGWDMKKSVGFFDSLLYLGELLDCGEVMKALAPQKQDASRGKPGIGLNANSCASRYTIDSAFLSAFAKIVNECADNPLCSFFTDPNIPDKVKSDVQAALAIYNKVIQDQKKISAFNSAYDIYNKNIAPFQSVNLNVQNLKSGKYTLERYVIDKEHSNSCRLNKKTEPARTDTECGVNGIIDQKIKEAKDKATLQSLSAAKQAFNDYLAGLSHSYNQADIDFFWNEFLDAISGKKNPLVVEQEIRNYCTARNLNPQQCVDDVKAVIPVAQKKGDEAYQAVYAAAIEAINSMDGVKLDKVESKTITVTGRSYQTTLEMEPYSVMLVKISTPLPTIDESITVYADEGTGNVKLMQGFLHGFYPNVDWPDPSMIKNLKPKFWRTGADPTGKHDLENYKKATQFGSRITWDASPGYHLLKGTWFNECGADFLGCTPEQCAAKTYPDPWRDGYDEYKNYIRNLVRSTIKNKLPVDYWDFWSEPNNYGRFGTQQQMFDTFKAFHDAVREVEKETGVKQKIVAPSIENLEGADWQVDNNCKLVAERGERTFKLEYFLAYTEANNLHLDALSWHEFPESEKITEHVSAVREYFKQHPKLCNPTCPEIHINEFQGQEQTLLPGTTIGWLYNLEKSKVDWASRSCWGIEDWHGCFGGLDGLLMQDSKTPQANYWVHRAYADMDGAKKLSAEISDPHTVAIASKNDATKEMHILVGRYCHYGSRSWIDCYLSGVKNGPAEDVPINIQNYPYGNQANVEIYRIPHNNNLPKELLAPVLVSKEAAAVQDEKISLIIKNFQDNDAYSIIVTPAKQAPILSQITPSSGTIGTEVMLTGTGFTPTENTINFGRVPNAIINLASSDGKTLTFTVPSQLCNQLSGSAVCPQLQPGTYDVSVANAEGTSNAVEFKVGDKPIDRTKGFLSLDPTSVTIAVGETVKVKAIFTPPRPACLDAVPACEISEQAPYEVDIALVSRDPSIARSMCPPESGRLTCIGSNGVQGVSPGKTTVAGTYTTISDTFIATMPVTVSISPARTVIIDAAKEGRNIARLKKGHNVIDDGPAYNSRFYQNEIGYDGALVRLHDGAKFYFDDKKGVASRIEQILDVGKPDLMFNILGMPKALASAFQDNDQDRSGCMRAWATTPPADYDKWKEYVKGWVAALKPYNIAYWEIWNEPGDALYPGCFWSGTEAEFFKLYKTTVEAIREAYGGIVPAGVKIGGPAVAGFGKKQYDTILGSAEPLYKTLPKFAGANNLPLDFFSWHFYDNGATRPVIIDGIPATKSELVKNGFSSSELIIDEYDLSYKNYFDAIAVAVDFVAMAHNGLDRQSLFQFNDLLWMPDGIPLDVFKYTGLFGLVDQVIVKPRYNVFKALHLMGDTTVEVAAQPASLSDTVLALKSSNRVSVMAVNPTAAPSQIMLSINHISPQFTAYEKYI